MAFIVNGPAVTNAVTNLDGSVTVMTSRAIAFSIPWYVFVVVAVAVGWLLWALVRPIFDRE